MHAALRQFGPVLADALDELCVQRFPGLLEVVHIADMVNQQGAQRDRDAGLGQRGHQWAYRTFGRRLGLPGGDALGELEFLAHGGQFVAHHIDNLAAANVIALVGCGAIMRVDQCLYRRLVAQARCRLVGDVLIGLRVIGSLERAEGLL